MHTDKLDCKHDSIKRRKTVMVQGKKGEKCKFKQGSGIVEHSNRFKAELSQ